MRAVLLLAAFLAAFTPWAVTQAETPQETEPQPSAIDATVHAIERVADGKNVTDIASETAETVEKAITEAIVETVKEAASDVVQDKTLVLRISREFIRKFVPKVVDRKTAVDRCMLGAHVIGEAVTNGQPLVVEGDDALTPGFTVQFSGTTVTRTRSSKGPVRVYTTGTASYTVRRRINFGPTGFSAEEASIECTYGSALNGLGLPPGLRGRIVKHFAMPEIGRMQPRANALAKRDVTSKVTTEFTIKTDTLVADLNRRTSWKDTLSIVAPNGEQRVRRLTTTPIYVEIRSSVGDAEIPDLPAESQSLRAPIELWVLGQPSPVMSAELLALWGLSKMAIKPIREKAEAAAERVKENLEDSVSGFEPELFGEWWVLRLGADLMERVLGKANDADANATPPGSQNEAVPDEGR